MQISGKGKQQQGNLDPEIFAGWNEKGLVIRAKILGNKILEHSDEKKLFCGDSLEFFLADARGRVHGAGSVKARKIRKWRINRVRFLGARTGIRDDMRCKLCNNQVKS
jgi:hypothetical protein